MTVTSLTSEQTFVGNGATTAFVFTFRADDLGWLVLSYVVGLNVITLNGDQDTTPGGTIDYSIAPPIGQQITISRNVPKTQLLNYTRFDPFDSESHEDALDKLTMMLQDNNRVTAEKSKSITVESPSAAEDITVFYTPVELRISSISSVLRGSGAPSVDWTLRYDSDRDAVGTEVITGGSVTASETTGDDITVFDNNIVPADSFIWLETTGLSGSVEMLHITIRFTEVLP
jgi:hypothetical protein